MATATEAARRLGITVEEVIKRVKKGELKIDMRLYRAQSARMKQINAERYAKKK